MVDLDTLDTLHAAATAGETVRDHARKRGSLDGADAQALEHALTITERERDAARAELRAARADLATLDAIRREAADYANRLDAWRFRNGEYLADIARLTKERDEARAENMCDVCAGEGKPINGRDCICAGSGKMSVAAQHLRRLYVEARAELARTALSRELGPPHRMDVPDGPVCRCGRPSEHESGACAVCVMRSERDRALAELRDEKKRSTRLRQAIDDMALKHVDGTDGAQCPQCELFKVFCCCGADNSGGPHECECANCEACDWTGSYLFADDAEPTEGE